MAIDEKALQQLIDKDAIRELVACYSRAIDRKDFELLRDLYTEDGTDSHGEAYNGAAEGYFQFIEQSVPHLPYSGHYVCNHLISVDGDEGNGEVYALAYHVVPGASGSGGLEEFLMVMRYVDTYRRCADGKWRFSSRYVTDDMNLHRPFTGGGLMGLGDKDPSYGICLQPLFQRGMRP